MDLSSLSKLDKTQFLKELEEFDFSYRDILNFSNDITFGIEIEYGKAKKDIIEKGLSKFRGEKSKLYYTWLYQIDTSFTNIINGKYYGGEFSSPIFKNKKEYYNQIRYLCELLKQNGATISERMASHIHVSKSILNDDLEKLRRFLKIYLLYEDIIYQFGSYGKTPRSVIQLFARPISIDLYEILNKGSYNSYEFLMFVLKEKFRAKSTGLNFFNVKPVDVPEYLPYTNTIEFRMCNATIDPVLIQNNINLFCYLLQSSTKEDIDLDKVDYDFKKFSDKVYAREKIKKDIDRAFEFSDIVFDKLDDKKYFLKQYMM